VKPSQRNRPDDPFVPGRMMRWRITAALVWWRHPRLSRAVTVALIAAVAVTVIIVGGRWLASPAHCVMIPGGRAGKGFRSCPR
jgi:hypothetical protein